jgi:opacity protein-like surface antigen
MNTKSILAGVACIVSALSANATTNAVATSPVQEGTSLPLVTTQNSSNTHRFGIGLTGIYGSTSTQISELDNYDMPEIGGAIVDFHFEIPTTSVTHEISLNVGHLYGDRSEAYWAEGIGPFNLKLKHSSTTVSAGYKINVPASEWLDIYAGAKLGVSYNKYELEASSRRFSESETFHHDCFTPSFLVGLKFKPSQRCYITVGYELYIPTGKVEGVSLDPYNCVTLGVGVNF